MYMCRVFNYTEHPRQTIYLRIVEKCLALFFAGIHEWYGNIVIQTVSLLCLHITAWWQMQWTLQKTSITFQLYEDLLGLLRRGRLVWYH